MTLSILQDITSDTRVQLGAALLIAGFVWRVSAKVTTVLSRLDTIEKKIGDHWTRGDQVEWIVQLSRDNPTLKVPLPEHKESAA